MKVALAYNKHQTFEFAFTFIIKTQILTLNLSEARRPHVAICTSSNRMSMSVGNGLRMRRCLRFRQSVLVATRSAVTLNTTVCH